MATVRAVCSYFVCRGMEDQCPLTQVSLQKLMYFAQGVNLATRGSRLFDENIYAWKWGPVVPSVYGMFKRFGSDPMFEEFVVFELGSEFLDERNNLTEEEEKVTKFIWDALGKRDPFELVRITHSDGAPWDVVVKKHPADTRDLVIPDDLIRDYFKKILAPTTDGAK